MNIKKVFKRGPREKGEKYQSIKSRILVLLEKRNDVTRFMLSDLLNVGQDQINMALTGLRKLGFKVWPPKGPGTPLKIATNQTDTAKYIAYRRRLLLPTARRMILTEFEAGEQFAQLENQPKQLLEILNNSTHEA